jgi:hypothetical protein
MDAEDAPWEKVTPDDLQGPKSEAKSPDNETETIRKVVRTVEQTIFRREAGRRKEQTCDPKCRSRCKESQWLTTNDRNEKLEGLTFKPERSPLDEVGCPIELSSECL